MRDPKYPVSKTPVGQRPATFGKRSLPEPEPARPAVPAPKKRPGVLTYAVLGAGAVAALTAALSSRSQDCRQTNPNQPQQCSARTSSGGFVHGGSSGGTSTAQSNVTRSGFGSTGASMHAGS